MDESIEILHDRLLILKEKLNNTSPLNNISDYLDISMLITITTHLINDMMDRYEKKIIRKFKINIILNG